MKEIFKKVKNNKFAQSHFLAYLTSLGSSISKNYSGVRYKTNTEQIKYSVTPNFYSLIVAPSGAGKSGIIDRYTDIYKEIETDDYKRYGTTATPEGIIKTLAKNELANIPLIYEIDEYAGFLKNAKSYKNSDTFSAFNTLFEKGNIREIYKHTSESSINLAKLCILAGIQPKTLTKQIDDFLIDSGFFGRFLFSFHDTKDYNESEDFELVNLETYNDFIREIEKPQDNIKTYEFTHDSNLLLDRYESKIKGYDKDDDFAISLQKSNFYVLRIALIIAVCREYKTKDFKQIITAQDVELAIQIVELYLENAKKVIELYKANNQNKITNRELINLLLSRYKIESETKLSTFLGKKGNYIAQMKTNKEQPPTIKMQEKAINPKYGEITPNPLKLKRK